MVRRRAPRDQWFPRAGQRRAHARDEVRVVRGVVRTHGGLEAREVQREARMTAMQLPRLAVLLQIIAPCVQPPTGYNFKPMMCAEQYHIANDEALVEFRECILNKNSVNLFSFCS